jgi:hypothetical protein
MNDKQKTPDEQGAGAWWAAAGMVVVAQVGLIALGVGAAYALERFAGTAEAWRGLGDAVRAIPAWWGLMPGFTLLALGGALAGLRYVMAQARAVEHRASQSITHAGRELDAPLGGVGAMVTLAEKHKARREGNGA